MRNIFLIVLFFSAFSSRMFAIPSRTVSGSQQFLVFCEDRPLRENLASAFDEVRRRLFTELGVRLGTSTPIYVNITPRKIADYRTDTWTMRWIEAPDGARVQLDILVDEQIKESRLQEHIVSALLLTLKYRDKPPAGGANYQEPPSWLVEGLSELIRQQTLEPDASLYRGLLNAKEMPKPLDWFKTDPDKLDATSLGIYRAYASALVVFFQGEPRGKDKLREFLKVATDQPEPDLDSLIRLYPALGKKAANLEKWWSLSLAKISSSDRYAAWSATDTSEAIGRIVKLNLKDGEETKTYTLDQYPEFIKNPGLKNALVTLNADLVRLSIHAHPLYRPVIYGWQELVSKLLRRKTKGVTEKVEELTALCTDLDQRLQSVSDYLTLLQATEVQTNHSDFEDYFRLMESFRAARPRATEPIAQYLDAMEAELK